VVEIPFEFLHNEIVVQVKVNGQGPFNMMLDTGTDPETQFCRRTSQRWWN